MPVPNDSNSSPLTVTGAASQLLALASAKDKPEPEETEDDEAAPAAEESEPEKADDVEPDKGEQDAEPDDADKADEDEATADDEQDSAKPDDVVFELEVEGKKVPVTREEARLGHLRQQDYTKKTQKVAEEHKAIEAERATVRQRSEQYAAGLAEIAGYLKQIVGEEPNWDKVRADTPDEYPRIHADWQVTKARLNDLTTERNRVRDEQQAAFTEQLKARVIEEAQKFGVAVPEFNDPIKGKALQESLLKYGTGIGFTHDEIGNTLDHRLMVILNKARLYDDLKAQKPKIEAKKTVPVLVPKTPVLKPGASRQQASSSKAKETAVAVARSARTGRAEDAAEAIRLMGSAA